MATVSPNQRPGMHHGVVERGLNSTVHSRLHTGRFGRMFRTRMSATFKEGDLRRLAVAMTAEPEIDEDRLKPKVTSETGIDDEENFSIPAGYTYFGQFVDHDITFDPMSSLIKMNDPNWKPFLGNVGAEAPFDRFTMGDLISLSLPLD